MSSIQGSSSQPSQVRNLGRYSVVQCLGSGPYSTTYQCKVDGNTAFYAVKVLADTHYQDMRFRRRFIDEASALTRAQPAPVCTVFEYVDDGTRAYFAMEYLDEVPLACLLGTACPTHIAASLITAYCNGMTQLQASSSTHAPGQDRELTPRNLFVLRNGGVRLTDVNLVIVGDGETRTGMTMRQLPYLAPELLLGQSSDERAHVWSLGVMCWELLMGRSLFARETELRIMNAILGDPIEMDELESRHGSSIMRTLQRALEREPGHRYDSIDAFAAALVQSPPDPSGSETIPDWMASCSEGALRPSNHRDARDDAETAQWHPQEPEVQHPADAQEVVHPAVIRPTVTPPTRQAVGLGWAPAFAVTILVLLTPRSAPEPAHGGAPSVSERLTPPAMSTPATASAQGSSDQDPEVQKRVRAPATPQATTEPNLTPATTKAKPSPPALATPRAKSADPAKSATAVSSGDVVVSTTVPGVHVFHQGNLLGLTPLRTRLPAGSVVLQLAHSPDGPRSSEPVHVRPGRLNLFTFAVR